MKTCMRLALARRGLLKAIVFSAGLIVFLAGSGVRAADYPVQAIQSPSQAELDQMLAPIALYPDPLLAQILMASTYPLEVVEAARWSRSNPQLAGDAAVRSVQNLDWDPSVKSMTAFPRILQTMDEHLEWTERLGEEFLSDQSRVMDSIQNLRHKAYDAGNLVSNDRVHVAQEGQVIFIESASPDLVYVPYYDPAVVYGVWWWPEYPPFYWAPWPGYFVTSGFGWGGGIVVISGFFFGDCDWREHRVRIVNVNNYYYPRTVPDRDDVTHHVAPTPGFWRHDPEHRHGAQYRNPQLRIEYSKVPVTILPVPMSPAGGGDITPGIGRHREKRDKDHREQPGIQVQPAPKHAPARTPEHERQGHERKLERSQQEAHPRSEEGTRGNVRSQESTPMQRRQEK